MLRQDHSRPQARTIRAIIALADPVEPVARRNHPCIRWRTIQIFAKVFEDGGMVRGDRGKVIESLVYAGRQARGRHVVAKYPLVRHLREETRLRDELAEHVGNIFLPLGRKRLLVARASAKGDDDDFPFLCRGRSAHKGLAPTRAVPSAKPAASRRKSRRCGSSAEQLPRMNETVRSLRSWPSISCLPIFRSYSP